MENHTCFLFLFLFFSIATANKVKLFVFGDSYADTGNCPKDIGKSWKEPYGSTFPGKPSGRFSDGLVLTDYIASYIGIKSPIPYKQRKSVGEKMIENGMNFAHGGTGVFNTLVQEPNMTTQIDFFQQVVDQQKKVYTKQQGLIINSSIALVSLAGNDYATYMSLNGTLQGLGDFSKLVIKQLEFNLKRINEMGVEKILVTAIEPLGCLPQFTASTSYKNCSERENSVSQFHNRMLEQSLEKLNNITTGGRFIKLDLYKAFMSSLNIQENNSTGKWKFENPLKPCCEGACGNTSVDKDGKKKKEHGVCENANVSFFWDAIHPSQQGWHAVSSVLLSSLNHHL